MSAQDTSFEAFASHPLGGWSGTLETRGDYIVFALYLLAGLAWAASDWCADRSEMLLRKSLGLIVWALRLIVVSVILTGAAHLAEYLNN